MAGGRKTNARNKRRKRGGRSTLEGKFILNYLQDYKDRATSLYDSTSSSSLSSSALPLPSKQQESTQPTIIDGVQFPPLENHAFSEQPYLILPKELSSYHRSIVHVICTDTVHLFHCGIDGENEGDRFVAVSIFSDGLAHVPGIVPGDCLPSTPLPAENHRPWIMRKDIDSSRETEAKKEKIREMMNHPGLCLRDTCDTIDLPQFEDENLSTKRPPEIGDACCMLVDSAERMEQCIKELKDNKPTEVAFDLECYNKRKEQQMTCLIQIATDDGRSYIIDVLGGKQGEVWDRVHGLAEIFADRSVVKIGHGIRGLDVQSLQRDFGIFVVNSFDTFEAARVLELEGKGLATVCARYGLQNSELYNDLKRQYQVTDWTRRPLTDPMILYARYDVHYLIQLRRLMIRDLVKPTTASLVSEISFNHTESTISTTSFLEDTMNSLMEEDEAEAKELPEAFEKANDSDETGLFVTEEDSLLRAGDLRMNPSLMRVISRSQENCLKFWNSDPEPPLKNKQFLSLAAQYRKESKAFTKSQLTLYYKIASWREDVAADEESLPGMICSLDYLARVAFHRPSSENGLRKINYTIPRFLTKDNRRYMKALFSYVKYSLADDNVVEDEVYPTFEDFKERLAIKKMIDQELAKEKMIEEQHARKRVIESEKQLSKKRMMKMLSVESDANASADQSLVSNPMFWALSCATVSVLICSFIGDRRRNR
mmetsp:Transcript_9566/g.23484  ORF Transcript_9566/g.23484 Transcript_9566/m.23484 type:complete len:711 (+) Transcript_9566:234-2366(+)